MKERPAVEVVNKILEVIKSLVAEMQGVAGANVARDRGNGAGLMGDDNREIHAKNGVSHTQDRAVQVNNEDGVGPDSSSAASGLVILANRNDEYSIKGTNQNEAEYEAFAAVIDINIAIFGTSAQRTAPQTLRSGKTVHLPSLIFLIRHCRGAYF